MGFREHVGALVGVVMLGIMCCSGMKNTEILVAHNSSGLHWEEMSTSYPAGTLMVGLTLVKGAASTGAVCLDGTLPGYHLHRGFGSGANNWLIQLEGGGWCNDVRTCVYRKTTRRGSSRYMERAIVFSGILSDKPSENPDFYNWNRVKLRYCDGASFTGDVEGEIEVPKLFFRGQRIWKAAMEDLLSKGMNRAQQALLSGCSAGGLAAILHCDEYRELMPSSTKVKCLSDAGLFLDVMDVSGGHYLRSVFKGIVTMQETEIIHSATPSPPHPNLTIAVDGRPPQTPAESQGENWQVDSEVANYEDRFEEEAREEARKDEEREGQAAGSHPARNMLHARLYMSDEELERIARQQPTIENIEEIQEAREILQHRQEAEARREDSDDYGYDPKCHSPKEPY